MKKIRFLMFFSAAFAALSIIMSCSKNNSQKNMDEEDGRREVMSGQNGIEEKPELATVPQNTTYVMRLDDITLTLYEVSGNKEIPLTAVNIDPSYYPPDDILELNKGVVAYSKEDGFARMENFSN